MLSSFREERSPELSAPPELVEEDHLFDTYSIDPSRSNLLGLYLIWILLHLQRDYASPHRYTIPPPFFSGYFQSSLLFWVS